MQKNFGAKKRRCAVSILAVLLVCAVWLGASFVSAKLFSGSDRVRDDIAITAHRGGAGYAPENSLTAVLRSLNMGVSSIEIDVQQTKDGHIVVCHDNTVDRTTNGSGKISEMTLDEIRALQLVAEDGTLLGEGVPTLGEVLEAMGGRAHLLLEIKRYADTPDEIESAVVKQLERYDAESWTTIQSFNDKVLERIYDLKPSIHLEKLAFCKILGLPLIFDGGLRVCTLRKYAHVESMNFFASGVTQLYIDRLHKAGKRVRLWTINAPEKVPCLDIDGIITDYPDLFMTRSNKTLLQ
ncbi:MAG: hypothetical protein IKA60_02880 [Rikenellaceae bacterium]|nr:hypothetical protein [Rikenellaceae bacterium]MBR2451951.1 hypothetical protein [Rikenellaceae bacterium]